MNNTCSGEEPVRQRAVVFGFKVVMSAANPQSGITARNHFRGM